MTPYVSVKNHHRLCCVNSLLLVAHHTSQHHTFLAGVPDAVSKICATTTIWMNSLFSFKLKWFLLKLFPKELLEFIIPTYLAGNKRLMFISRNLAHRKPSFSASDFRNARLREQRGRECFWTGGGTWSPICHLPEVTRQLSVLSTSSLTTAVKAFLPRSGFQV